MPKVNDLKEFILMERQQRNNLAAFNLLTKKDDAVSQLREYLNTSDKRSTLLHINDLKYGQPTDSDLKIMTARLKLLQTDFNDLAIPKPFSNSSEEMDSELKFIRMLRKLSEDPNTIRDIDDEDKDLISPFMRFAKAYHLPVDETFLRLLVDDVNTLSMRFKYMFNRPRPKQLAAQKGLELIAHEGESANSPSYPSAHSTAGRVLGKALGDKYPEHADEFEKIGASIGLHRLIAGLHYPTDHAAGMMLGDQIYQKGLVKDHTNFMMPESEALVRAVQQAITKHAEGFNLNKSIPNIDVLVDIFKADDSEKRYSELTDDEFNERFGGDFPPESTPEFDYADAGEDAYGTPLPDENENVNPVDDYDWFDDDETEVHPRAVTIHSGGAQGSDSLWAHQTNKGVIAGTTRAWGYKGHYSHGGDHTIIPNIENDKEAWDMVHKANKTLGRSVPKDVKEKPWVKLLLRNWYQVRESHAVIAACERFDPRGGKYKDKVDGGTGWAVQMGINEGIPVHIFNEETNKWYTWDDDAEGQKWDEVSIDDIPFYQDFAGVGTRGEKQPNGSYKLKENTVNAIEEYSKRLGAFQKTDKDFTPVPDLVKHDRAENRQSSQAKIAGLRSAFSEDAKAAREALESRKKDPNNLFSRAEGHENANFFRDLVNTENSRSVIIDDVAYRNADEAFKKAGTRPDRDFDYRYTEHYFTEDPKYTRTGYDKMLDSVNYRQRDEVGGAAFELTGYGTPEQKLRNKYHQMVRVLTAKLEQHGDLVDGLQARASSKVDGKGDPMTVEQYISNLNHQTGSHDEQWTGDGLDSNFIRALHDAYVNVTNNDIEIPEVSSEAEYNPEDKSTNIKYLIDGVNLPQETWSQMSDAAKLQVLQNTKHLGPRLFGNKSPTTGREDTPQLYPSARAAEKKKLHGELVGISETGERIIEYDSSPYERQDPMTNSASFLDIVYELIPQLAHLNEESSHRPSHILRLTDDSYKALVEQGGIGEGEFGSKGKRPKNGEWSDIMDVEARDFYNMYQEGSQNPENGAKLTEENIRRLQSGNGSDSFLLKIVRMPEDSAIKQGLGITDKDLNAFHLEEYARKFPREVRAAYFSELQWQSRSKDEPNTVRLRARMAPSAHDRNWGTYEGRYRDGILTQLVEIAQRLDTAASAQQAEMFDDLLNNLTGRTITGYKVNVDPKTGEKTTTDIPILSDGGIGQRSVQTMANIKDTIGTFHAMLYPPEDTRGPARQSLSQRKENNENAAIADEVRSFMGTEEFKHWENTLAEEVEATAEEVEAEFRNTFEYELDRMHPNQRKYFEATIAPEYGMEKLRKHLVFSSLIGAWYPTQYYPGTTNVKNPGTFPEAFHRGGGALGKMAPWMQEKIQKLVGELMEKFDDVEERLKREGPPTPPEEPKTTVDDLKAEMERSEVDVESDDSKERIEGVEKDWEDYDKELEAFPEKLKNYNERPTNRNQMRGQFLNDHLLNAEYWGDENGNRNIQLYTDLFARPIPTTNAGEPVANALYNRYNKAYQAIASNTYFKNDDEGSHPAYEARVTQRDLQTFLKILGITGGDTVFPSQAAVDMRAKRTVGAKARYYNVGDPTPTTADQQAATDADAIALDNILGEAGNRVNPKTRNWFNKPENLHYRQIISGAAAGYEKKIEEELTKLLTTKNHSEILDSNDVFKPEIQEEIEELVLGRLREKVYMKVKQYDPNGEALGSDPTLTAFKENFIDSVQNYREKSSDKFPQIAAADYIPSTPRPSQIRNGFESDVKERVLDRAVMTLGLTAKDYPRVYGKTTLSTDFDRTDLEAKQKIITSWSELTRHMNTENRGKLEDTFYKLISLAKATKDRREAAEDPALSPGEQIEMMKAELDQTDLHYIPLSDPAFKKWYEEKYQVPLSQAAREWDDWDRGITRTRFTTRTKEGKLGVGEDVGVVAANLQGFTEELDEIGGFEGELGYAPETASQIRQDTDYDAQMDGLFEAILPKVTLRQRDQIIASFGVKDGLDDQYFGTTHDANAYANSSDKNRLQGYFRGVRQVLLAVKNGDVLQPNERVSVESPELADLMVNIAQNELTNIVKIGPPTDPSELSKDDYPDMNDEAFETLKTNSQNAWDRWQEDLPDPLYREPDEQLPVGKKGHVNRGVESMTDQDQPLTWADQRTALREANLPLTGEHPFQRDRMDWLPATDFKQYSRNAEARDSDDIIDGKEDEEGVVRPTVHKYNITEDGRYIHNLTSVPPEQQEAWVQNRIDRDTAQSGAIAEYLENQRAEQAALREQDPPDTNVSTRWRRSSETPKVEFTGAGSYREQRQRGMTDEEIAALGQSPDEKSSRFVQAVSREQKARKKAIEDTQQKPEVDPDLDAKLETITPPSEQEVETAQEGMATDYISRVEKPIVNKGTDDAG